MSPGQVQIGLVRINADVECRIFFGILCIALINLDCQKRLLELEMLEPLSVQAMHFANGVISFKDHDILTHLYSAVVLILWVTTSLQVKLSFHGGYISDNLNIIYLHCDSKY